mmetsp:Transcript_38377/g.124272  ORF Transcript_38377/g.124272 Transcript_38377/m.124272 type:complete len:209 (-) Transcript_38377:905-1531(-)
MLLKLRHHLLHAEKQVDTRPRPHLTLIALGDDPVWPQDERVAVNLGAVFEFAKRATRPDHRARVTHLAPIGPGRRHEALSRKLLDKRLKLARGERLFVLKHLLAADEVAAPEHRHRGGTESRTHLRLGAEPLPHRRLWRNIGCRGVTPRQPHVQRGLVGSPTALCMGAVMPDPDVVDGWCVQECQPAQVNRLIRSESSRLDGIGRTKP